MGETGEHFAYGETETAWLKGRDRALAEAIEAIGPICRRVEPDLFRALVNSIVGQQISTKAQQTIWLRMTAGIPDITPKAVCAMPEETLQAFGISMRKARYIKEAAAAAVDGRLCLSALPGMADADVCKCLVRLPGVGVWTAEMLMIFSMQRPDVLSFGDLAILRGMRMLYRHRAITPQLFAKYKRRYSPYASVAGLYLWAIAGGALPGASDPAAQ